MTLGHQRKTTEAVTQDETPPLKYRVSKMNEHRCGREQNPEIKRSPERIHDRNYSYVAVLLTSVLV